MNWITGNIKEKAKKLYLFFFVWYYKCEDLSSVIVSLGECYIPGLFDVQILHFEMLYAHFDVIMINIKFL